MKNQNKAHKTFEFQIIAGDLKGKKIKAPDLEITRPPLSRLRRAIFDFLNPYLDEAAFLDLFSGTGSYLFEAISRGASQALGIELEPKLVRSINDQAEKLGVDARLLCRYGDTFEMIGLLAGEGRRFNIIMIAPPQYKQMIDRSLNLLSDHSLLSPGGLIVCQHDSSETDRIDYSKWSIFQQRKYGNTTFTVLEQP